MYRFLVVDDEFYVRQRVKLCIPWEDYGFTFVGEASSAKEALKFIETQEIHLIIADISMPEMNGLELIKACRTANPGIRIIILSGFATFEYAKQAIAYGVTSYLLKPIDTEELVKALTGIRDALDKDANTRKERQIWQQAKEMEDVATRDAFFRFLLVKHGDFQEVPGNGQLSRYLSPEIAYFVIVLEIPLTKGISVKEQARCRDAAREIVAGIASKHCDSLPTVDLYGHPVLLCRDTANAQEKFSILEEAAQVVPDMLHADFIFGYGHGHVGTEEGILKAYKEALYFLTFRTLYGVGQNPFDALVPDQNDWNTLLMQGERLKNLLEVSELEGVRHELHEIFLFMAKRLFCLQALETELSRLLTIGINYASKRDLPYLVAENDWILYSCSEITHSGSTLAEIEGKLLGLFSSLVSQPTDSELPMIHQTVEDAVKLIERDFCRCDMGLQWISSTLLISPSYLSRNFRKLRGTTISKYIIKCRMERARELLEQTGMTTTQVSEEVGYRDVFYFSKCFKKYFGVPPSQMLGRESTGNST